MRYGKNPITLRRKEKTAMKARNDPSTKPYYRCLSCPRFRKLCAGLPTRDMTLQEWCEFIRDVSDAFHLTNSYIAEKADVSPKTVELIESLNCGKDIMRSTARRIEIVVLGPVGSHTCHLDHDPAEAAELIAKLRAEVDYWKRENDLKSKIIEKYIYN